MHKNKSYLYSRVEKKLYKASILSELPDIAKSILLYSRYNFFAFFGNMGVGKTTLIKELTKQLGVRDDTSSPTYSIVNEYYSQNIDKPIYHFDFYRLNNEEEAYDIGYEDYFYTDSYCFIEWGEKIPNLLPMERHEIIMTNELGYRTIKFN